MGKNVDRHQSTYKTLSCQLLRKGGKQMGHIFLPHEDTRATWRMGGQSAVIMATVELH
jgi:hypothetical protein